MQRKCISFQIFCGLAFTSVLIGSVAASASASASVSASSQEASPEISLDSSPPTIELNESPNCGTQGGNKTCRDFEPCCSQWGFCGNSDGHCGAGCQPTSSFNGECKKR